VLKQRIGVVELSKALFVAQLAGKLGKDCRTQSHKNKKGPQAGQAHLELALKTNQMPMDVGLDELLMMQKPYDVMIAYFLSIASDIQTEKKPKAKADKSTSSLPGSWVPINLDQVDLMEEASWMMKSPTKQLKMGPFLAKMADSTPMGGQKLEPMIEISLDGTRKGTSDDQTHFLILNFKLMEQSFE
jgi:hypothetical protein